ncbi:MAG: N-acetylmuramoyl-L-alanine amidase [Ruminococcaceae bacterium]|nr:N-acetylmuramoyl-L-alanine amidase [Oscillospiraceae bacterium]
MRKLRERLALMPAVVRTLLLILAAILLAGLVWLPTWAGAAPAAAVTDVGTLPESQPTDLLLEGAPLDTRYTLVLDAGHGGIDGGAVDTTGTVLEKDVNQTMVDKVTALLAAHANQLRVVQAVEPDTNATVLARANTAVKEQADLFLSLHLNGDTHESSRGFQCFPTPPGRPYADESLRFARLLVQQVQQTDAFILGTEGIFYCYYVRQGESGYYKEILDIAQTDPATPRADESFGVVEYSGCPSVLIEQWFITSAEDMALFNSEAGYDTMANSIYQAICAYFQLN